MQQIVVPQFIDVEDKIVGPITTRQFIILVAFGFLVFLEYKLSDFGLFLLEFVITLGLAVLFAFVKINGMPFHFFLLNFIQSAKRPKTRSWHRSFDDMEIRQAIKQPVVSVKPSLSTKHNLSTSRLQELTLLIDTGGVYRPDEEENFSKSKSEEQGL